MRKFQLELPFPPSANKYWRVVNNRVVTSRHGRQYQKDVSDIVWRHVVIDGVPSCGKDPISHLIIIAFPPDARRRDIDNIIKPCIDALKLAGLFEDDSQIQAVTAAWARDEEGKLICAQGGMLVVTVEVEGNAREAESSPDVDRIVRRP